MAHQPVFDYAASEPWLVSDQMESMLQQNLDSGEDGMTAWAHFESEKVRQLRKDPEFQQQLRELYDQSGVNLISPTMGTKEPNLSHSEATWRDLSAWQARFDAIEWLHKVSSPAEAQCVIENGDIGVVINSQNFGRAIKGDVSNVESFFNQGMRIFQLTYNYQNRIATGCSDPSDGGLSSRGRRVVEKLNQLGGIVDLSHCGYQTTLDTVTYSNQPVAYTHTACQSVADHFRGKTDEEIEALSETDGYMGIVGLPYFLAPQKDQRTLEDFMDHLNHAISILGVKRVGIGTDFFPADTKFPDPLLEVHEQRAIERGFDESAVKRRGMGTGIGEFKTYTDWPVIKDRIGEQYSDSEVDKILGENFLSFWNRVC